MRNTFILLAISYLFVLGVTYPFVAGMAYIWIDIVKPQSLGYDFLNSLPMSMIGAVFVVVVYYLKPSKSKTSFSLIQILLLVLAAWVTITTYLADPILGSWRKWDPAFKCLVFSAFIPFIFRSRIQIEAYLLTIIFSISTFAFVAGAKTLLGGGGYGSLATLGGGNSGFSESSTLAAVGVMLLPLIHYMRNHSIIFGGSKFFKLMMLGLSIICVAAVVGTAARTGLIALIFLAACYIFHAKNKVILTVLLASVIGIGAFLNLEGTRWGSRMSTISTYEQESSAAGRIAVWKWTMDYVSSNPMGGGFDVYRLNNIMTVDSNGAIGYFPPSSGIGNGKAFHSIYFEVLGEQGIFGFIVYYFIMLLTFFQLGKISRVVRNRPELAWIADLALKIRLAQMVMLVSGLFIGIAYQPSMFYLVAATVSLMAFLKTQQSSVPSWSYNAKTV